MDQALSIDEVIPNLWNEYKKSREYLSGLKMAIPEHHRCVEKREEEGLARIYEKIVKKVTKDIKGRYIGEWLVEWKNMNKLLFMNILKNKGDWRKKEVRIGDPYDDCMKLADSRDIPRLMQELANDIHGLIGIDYKNRDELYEVLAKIHHRFVMIHPFDDGNGRIARAITDQISLFFGLPTAIVGYPRHDKPSQKRYHQAVYECAKSKNYHPLAVWIKSYVELQIERLA